MRPFQRFVDLAPVEKPLVEPSDKIVTPATAMTGSRPILAAKAADMLIKGQKPVAPLVALMALTDAEGKVARWFDAHYPDWGIGSTRVGAEADQIADSLAFLIVGQAILRAPRVSLAGKAAAGLVLAQEGYKSGWAIARALEYKQLTGEKLVIPTDPLGKEAVIEKCGAIICATLTGDTDKRTWRTAWGVAAAGFAVLGSGHGEQARRGYEQFYQDMLANLEPDAILSTVLNPQQ